MRSSELTPLIQSLGQHLQARNWQMTCVESCTGGALMACLTDYAGASNWFYGGFVSYDNAAKIALGVSPQLLQQHGAVSAQIAQEMTRAAFSRTALPLIVAITGIAGPTGGSLTKPVGTVFIDVLCNHVQHIHHTKHYVFADQPTSQSTKQSTSIPTREAIRWQAQVHAVQLSLQVLRKLS